MGLFSGIKNLFTQNKQKEQQPSSQDEVRKMQPPKFQRTQGTEFSNMFSNNYNSLKYSSLFQEMYYAYNSNGLFKRAISKIHELFIRQDFIIKSQNEQFDKYLNYRLREVEIGSGQTTNKLVMDQQLEMILYGNQFIYKKRASGLSTKAKPYYTNDSRNKKLNPVVAQYVIPARFVSISKDRKSYYIDEKFFEDSSIAPSYGDDEYVNVSKSDSTTKKISQDDILHIKYQEDGNYFSKPFSSNQVASLINLYNIEQKMLDVIEDNRFSIVVYKVGTKEAPGKEEDINEVKRYLEYNESDSTIVIPFNHEVKVLNISGMKEIKEYMDYYRNKFLNEVGISGIGLGEGGSANRATAEEANLVTYDLVSSMQKTFAEQFKVGFLYEFIYDSNSYKIEKMDDKSLPEIIFPEPNIDLNIKKENHEVFKFEHNVQTEKETRQHIGLENLKDSERNNMFYKLHGESNNSEDTNNRNSPQNQYNN